MKPSICLFSESLAPSGVGQHMVTLAGQLRGRYELSLGCPPSPGGLRLLKRAEALGISTLPLEVRGEQDDSERLTKWLQTRRVDLFHSHAGVSWEGHGSIHTARAAGVAVVRTEHLAELTSIFSTEQLPDLVYSPYHRAGRRLDVGELNQLVRDHRADYRLLTEQIDRLICVSEGVRDSLVETGAVPVDKLRVVRNGIEAQPAVSGRAETRQRLGIGAEAKIVLTVGRMIDVKAHHHLLEAVPAVVERQPTARFLWIGGGPLEQELDVEVRRLGLEDSVILAGQRGDVPDVIAAADLFVLPSLVEGLPLGVLEAMAAGLPVVGTHVCGTSEVIVDGVTGRLVEPGGLAGPGNPAPMADAILEILQDPQLATQWGSAGKARVEREFSAERMARETADVYDELLG